MFRGSLHTGFSARPGFIAPPIRYGRAMQGTAAKHRTIPLRPRSDAWREATLAKAMARAPRGDVWVFAYGSLMWDPCFPFEARAVGRLEGYVREFHVWSTLARGTPDRPGLTLGLVKRRGACDGVLFRLSPRRHRPALEALWAREMFTGIYRPKWLLVRGDDAPLTALTFVTDRRHAQYAGGLGAAERAAIIGCAAGKFGRSREYLADTVATLKAIGRPVWDLVELLKRADRS